MRKHLLVFISVLLIVHLQPLYGSNSDLSRENHNIIKKNDSVTTNASRINIVVQGDKKSWWSDWLPFFATIMVALLAYRGVVKQSRASSISGFRVRWIEDLRECYSKFWVALRNVSEKVRQGKIDIQKPPKDEDIDQVYFLRTKIKLMLNQNESEHIEFWEAFTKYVEEYNEYYKGAYSSQKENELDNKRIEVEKLLLSIFKNEWDKAKKFG